MSLSADEPTHFNVLIAGTGLHESILAAALSKAGYSVLQLDAASYYGTEHASLSLKELADWARDTEGAEASSPSPPDDLLRLSQRFAVSLFPMLLRAKGPALDLLVRSKVATYLQFGLLSGVGLWRPEAEDKKGKGRVDRVPASKADVFNDSTLSLVEKRRLTKLLLFAAGQDPLEEDKVLSADPNISFPAYLAKAFSLSGAAADSLAYALALCTASSDPALPALRRLRSIIHAVGRYGPSPYLVGHYGGAGDLVGGFSRICAVWGGGQILGRPLGQLDLFPPVGKPVPASQPPFKVHENPPPPLAAPEPSADSVSLSSTRPLGIPVVLEPGEAPTILTGDWVISSSHLLSTLFPDHAAPSTPSSLHLIAVLPSPVPFPPPREPRGPDEGDEPDSNLFVFPPQSLREEVGTVTAFQAGKGTMSAPDGYHIVYLSAPLLSPSSAPVFCASTLLQPYLDALLSLTPATPRPSESSDPADSPAATPATPAPIEPLYTVAYLSPSPPSPSSSTSSSPAPPLPPNFLPLPPLPSAHSSAALVDALDDLVPLVEETFWRIVGDEGRKEGVQFFAKEQVGAGEEDEEE